MATIFEQRMDEMGPLVFSKGLEPEDFIKVCVPLSSADYDMIEQVAPGTCNANLGRDHISNQLTRDEIECLCYERSGKVPSYLVQEKNIQTNLALECSSWIPEGLTLAQLTLSYEKSLGKRSYKNFLRRLNREAKNLMVNNTIANGNHDAMLVDLDKVNYPDPGDLVAWKTKKQKEQIRKMKKKAKEATINFD